MNPIIAMAAHVRRREACQPWPVAPVGGALAEPLVPVLLWDELATPELGPVLAQTEGDGQWPK
jgi:hypothetical protein